MENIEGLMKAILPEEHAKDLPDRFADLSVSSSDTSQYLQRLSTMGLNKLIREADRITEERSSVISQTQELAFQEYPTFIETAQCTKDLSKTFRKVGQTTEKLSNNLANLKEKCVEFSKTAQSLSSARRLTSLALSRHTQLLEILELPQLMDTCVRNGYWEEALQLSAYVARLEQKLTHIPLIVSVAQEVQSCSRLMLSQLIAQLKMPADLLHCIAVVGYLKRMNVFTEEELRLKFLQARNAWFKSTIDEIPKEDAHQHVLKLINLSRVHLFEIATQYRGIFTDEDFLVLSNQDPFTNESAIFYSWVVEKVAEFLAALEADLPRIPSTQLESVFNQCMYFGMSFGHIGSDLRALVVPLFTRVVYNRLDLALNKCEARFAESMTNYAVVQVDMTKLDNPTPSDKIQPPMSLAKFGPLAELCNNLINAFNEFRTWAPIQLIDPAIAKIQQTLVNTSKTLAEFHRQEQGAFKPSEEEGFNNFLQLYRNDLVPFIQRILVILFPASQIAAQTGFQVAEITKGQLTSLNKGAIIQPIYHLFDDDQKTKRDSASGQTSFYIGEDGTLKLQNSMLNSDAIVNSHQQEHEKTTESSNHIVETPEDKATEHDTVKEEDPHIMQISDGIAVGTAAPGDDAMEDQSAPADPIPESETIEGEVTSEQEVPPLESEASTELS